MRIPRSIKSNHYPSFISRHQAATGDIKKIFPSIGLGNCTKNLTTLETIAISNDDIVLYLKELSLYLKSRYEQLLYDARYTLYESALKLNSDAQFLKKISSRIDSWPTDFIARTKTSLNLIIPNDITDPHIGIERDLFNSLKISGRNTQELCIHLGNSENGFIALKNKKLKISFSSSGNKGIWDIATMSMRGISSCQAWDKSHSKALIGSIIDPFAGILFLSEQGTMPEIYGQKMIKRAVIRYVVSATTKKPAIMIERIYPHAYVVPTTDYMTLSIFRNFINKKTKGKFPIFYGQQSIGSKEYQIPSFKNIKKLTDVELSYRDSKIEYATKSTYDF